jgi:drug/metabolite transporter (DMT)-like permease
VAGARQGGRDVIAGILLALGASIGWGASDFLGGLTTRSIALRTVLGVSQLAALLGIAVVLAIRWQPIPLDGNTILAAGAGVASVTELGLLYLAMSRGPIMIIAPVAAAGAVVPVTVGLARGDPAGALVIGGIACTLLGALGAAWEPGDSGVRPARPSLGVLLAFAAAAAIGAFFLLLNAASKSDPLGAVGAMRLASCVTVVVCLPVMRKPSRPAAAQTTALVWRALIAIGVCDVAADTAFAAASGHGAVSSISVLASLYPVVTVLLARTILRERVQPIQLCGVVTALAGVVMLGVAAPS